MTEWTVVTVIAVLAGLLGAIIKPIIRLNTTLTKLTESVNALEKNIAAMRQPLGFCSPKASISFHRRLSSQYGDVSVTG